MDYIRIILDFKCFKTYIYINIQYKISNNGKQMYYKKNMADAR